VQVTHQVVHGLTYTFSTYAQAHDTYINKRNASFTRDLMFDTHSILKSAALAQLKAAVYTGGYISYQRLAYVSDDDLVEQYMCLVSKCAELSDLRRKISKTVRMYKGRVDNKVPGKRFHVQTAVERYMQKSICAFMAMHGQQLDSMPVYTRASILRVPRMCMEDIFLAELQNIRKNETAWKASFNESKVLFDQLFPNMR